MRKPLAFASVVFASILGVSWSVQATYQEPANIPASALELAKGWRIELVKTAPEIVFPTAVVVSPNGTIYLGQDPMDMPGPPTVPGDSVLAIKDGKVSIFAEKLWAVMGLEWAGDTLFVVHPPFLSAFKDLDGDGRADNRTDLVVGLGPKLPGFSGINDHVASGIRLGMDGSLYISVGDKGIPKATAADGSHITLKGGGVVRVRPDGSRLEVVSSGERNPLSVMLTAEDEVFTYGNDDDSKLWPNSLTHHIVGGHYGYPYEFLTKPWRCLPIVGGLIGGSGTQGVCYTEGALPAEFDGNLFVCDWGLQRLDRIVVARKAGTFELSAREPIVSKGKLGDFRPFSIATVPRGSSFYLVDWAFNGWLAEGPKTGRLFKLAYEGKERSPEAKPLDPNGDPIERLSDPALSVRLEAQRALVKQGAKAIRSLAPLVQSPTDGRAALHAVWALNEIPTPEARAVIRGALDSTNESVQVQAIRALGLAGDQASAAGLSAALGSSSPVVRREAAVSLGRLNVQTAGPALHESACRSRSFCRLVGPRRDQEVGILARGRACLGARGSQNPRIGDRALRRGLRRGRREVARQGPRADQRPRVPSPNRRLPCRSVSPTSEMGRRLVRHQSVGRGHAQENRPVGHPCHARCAARARPGSGRSRCAASARKRSLV